jgi:L-rhamnose mutarotase
MRSFAMALDLVDDPVRIAEYDAHHQEVWPEVRSGLRAIGITRMLIYRCGTRLFMSFEAPDDFDPDRDYQGYAEDPRCRDWDALMRSYQRQVPAASESVWWTPMTVVFDLGSE